MRTIAIALLLSSLAAGLAAAEPLRADKGWAIHAQAGEADWQALAQGQNLALGRTVQALPAPNYAPAADVDDLKQLTDGQVAGRDGRMWSDKRAAGWAYHEYVRLVIDLGSVQPVGRVVVRFQGGIGPKDTVPSRIALGLSQDGDYYFPARTLTEKVHADDNPALTFQPLPAEQLGIYAFALEAGYGARYVRLDLAAHGLVVCDEVAVLAAAAPAQDLPAPPPGKREWLDNVFDRREQFKKMVTPGNLISGKALRYAPMPGYRLTTNDNDPLDLTDGKPGERTDERIWFDKNAVCWQGAPEVTIFADLGEVQPVGSVVARFLGGGEQGGLTFPDEIRVLLSTDGENYYQVAARHKRGLDDLSADAYDLPEERLAWVHNFVLPVGRRARYLALQGVHQKQFLCTDEVAVVKGADNLPAFTPADRKKVTIVTSGVAFEPVWGDTLPVATMPLRCRLSDRDARAGKAYNGACTLVLDLPENVRLAAPAMEPAETIAHDGRNFRRYRLTCNRGKLQDFYLHSLLPAGKRDVLYTYGDAGNGLENERKIAWQSLDVPKVRQWPRRLHVSLAWGYSESLCELWPDYLAAMKHLGFNCVASFPRYWKEADVPKHQRFYEEARRAGFQVVINESPAGALSEDRRQPETRSQLASGPGEHVCPSYRGEFYQKELDSFARHAVWVQPDYVFYDTEAFWAGAVQDAPRCSRCQERFKQGTYKTWEEFRGAMGSEMQQQIKARTDKALADAGIARKIIGGGYRTEPLTPLNDGVFQFGDLYPGVLQIAMPSL